MSVNIQAESQSKPELVFLLLGKTGSGKSAVGNSILNRKAFVSSAKPKSVTTKIFPAWTERDGYQLMVIDGPGLEDTGLDQVHDKERACNNLELAVALSGNGVHVFVLVMTYGVRFTKEERSTVDALGKILGPKWLSHYGVVVMTRGGDMEDDEKDITFIQWCKENNADYQRLFAECDYRCVPFENSKRAEEQQKLKQFQDLISFAKQIKEKCGRYTNEHFHAAAANREKLIVELKAPILKLEIQKRISLLTSECLQLSTELPYGEKMKSVGAILEKAKALLEHIDKEDRGTGVLSDLKQEVLKLKKQAKELGRERSPENTSRIVHGIKETALQMEAIRTDSSLWSKTTRAAASFALGAGGVAIAGMTVASGGLLPIAGAVLGGISGAFGTIGAAAALTTDDTQTISVKTITTEESHTGPKLEELND